MIETTRLILREWTDEDDAPFAELNADPEVMRHFPKTLTRQESDDLIIRFKKRLTENGYCLWAVELKKNREFIGAIGLSYIDAESDIPHVPFVEVGWRLARNHWRNGYAFEGANASLAYAFNQLNLDAVYAFTAKTNVPSESLMKKLGMTNTQSDFIHPKIAKDSPLQPLCLYKIDKEHYHA